jgi:hypothetical protein
MAADESPLAEVVDGYAKLASTLVDRWTAHVALVASRINDGNYDANSAAVDLAATAKLTGETGFLFASKTLDAVALLAPRGPEDAESGTFTSPIPGAALSVTDPFTSLDGASTLAANMIRVEPTQLEHGATTFSLRLNAKGCRAGVYRGQVTATPTTGTAQRKNVWIVIQ